MFGEDVLECSNLFPEVLSDPLLTIEPHHEPEFQRPVDKKKFRVRSNELSSCGPNANVQEMWL